MTFNPHDPLTDHVYGELQEEILSQIETETIKNGGIPCDSCKGDASADWDGDNEPIYCKDCQISKAEQEYDAYKERYNDQ